MRFMLTLRFDVGAGNEMVASGKVAGLMQTALAQLKPEAAYFGPVDGHRGGYLVVNVDDPSQIPAMTEPFFQAMHATVTFVPVMTAEELRQGIAGLEQTTSATG